MSDKARLNVVLFWHMHQPQYADMRTGHFHLPWTYLHVIKDYVDMAAHLEAIPDARAVINFTPTLLEQIDDYSSQIQEYFKDGRQIGDEMLENLVAVVLPSSPEKRLEIIKHCLRANEDRLIKRYPQYQQLAEQARFLEEHPDAIIYLHDQYLADLLAWFHLAWMGETVRRTDTRISSLIEKGHDYTINDRLQILRVIDELCSNVINRYRRLAERQQIELSFTPYGHPIMPLLLDIESAREAIPDASLPVCLNYPDGKERVDWHITRGIEVFQRYFGFPPAGCWPSEGSISEETVRVLSSHGLSWLASGETVLRNSLDGQATDADCIHRSYRFKESAINCFFRDDGLSDMIGFNYADWHADDAVANMIHHLENIADSCRGGEDAIVSIILDGENAWEYYPENGYHFLHALYRELARHDRIRLTTYSDFLKQNQNTGSLEKVVAGSWVYGTFSTWIGNEDKNTGWDMLCDAKKCVDEALATGDYDQGERERIETQLAICEGSDWFWWFGDYNPAESVRDFEYLYRLQLSHLYQLIGKSPPSSLSESFTHGSGQPSAGGTMRRGKEH